MSLVVHMDAELQQAVCLSVFIAEIQLLTTDMHVPRPPLTWQLTMFNTPNLANKFTPILLNMRTKVVKQGREEVERT